MIDSINIDAITKEVTYTKVEAALGFEIPIEIDYDAEVNRLIRQKYTVSQEFSVLRQKEEKPEEFAEYNDYCETCKMQEKEIIESHS